MAGTPVHYLRPNHGVWTPPAVVFLDTEAAVIPGTDPEVLALTCWDAHYIDRRVKKNRRPRDTWGAGQSAAELIDWLGEVTRNRETVWAYAHNLGFDLVTTRLPLLLAQAGWTITDAAMGGRSPWLRLARGHRRLALLDSTSWLPQPLEEIGRRLGMAKPALPQAGDPLASWHARCRADVSILERAMLDLMGWWEDKGLGNWTITGSASGWNAYRHTPTEDRVVIDPDPELVKADRLAVHGGRRGTWVIGEHRAGPFYELDFAAAYPTIAATCPLPVQRTRRFQSLPTDDRLVGGTRWGITARCLVQTDTPRWPARVGRRTWYPVGTFWTELAGPEIAEARELGCLLSIGPGSVHRLGWNMAPWAEWVMRVTNGQEPGAPAVAQLAAKRWGRSVIGKWAQRGFEKIKLGPSPTLEWGVEDGWDHSANCAGTIVDLAGQRWWVAASGDPENAYPAILAWVESEVRVRLSRALEAIGPGAVLQCDTDGMIVAGRTVGTKAARGQLIAPEHLDTHGRVAWVLDELRPHLAPLTLRDKSRADHVTILGPQHLMIGGQQRLSGIPGGAVPDGELAWKVKTWPGLRWQMANGDPRGYVRPERRVVIAGPHPTGWVLADGSVVPVEARHRPDGTNVLAGWESSSYAREGAVRGPRQHAELEGVW